MEARGREDELEDSWFRWKFEDKRGGLPSWRVRSVSTVPPPPRSPHSVEEGVDELADRWFR
jgi:hypothetical protein